MKNDIETVVFDLDGTVYQNTVFHRDYLHFLVEGTGYEGWHTQLVEFAEQVYAGRRLQMNCFYSPKGLPAKRRSVFLRAGTVPSPTAGLSRGAAAAGYSFLPRDAWARGDFNWQSAGPVGGRAKRSGIPGARAKKMASRTALRAARRWRKRFGGWPCGVRGVAFSTYQNTVGNF